MRAGKHHKISSSWLLFIAVIDQSQVNKIHNLKPESKDKTWDNLMLHCTKETINMHEQSNDETQMKSEMRECQ